jgi:acyl-CoA reductase-like NAD-dependent aldehyde dehydrogenase
MSTAPSTAHILLYFIVQCNNHSATMIIARLAAEAGFPAGVVNIVHGTVDTVNFICDAPDIKAVSFV